MIFGTGGTTGLPKGAEWSRQGLGSYLAASALALESRRTDVEMYFAPHFHIALATCAFATLYAGGCCWMEPRFDADRIVAALATGEVTRIFGPPTALTRVIEHADFEPAMAGAVRQVLFGSTVSDPSLPERLARAFPRAILVSGYGATEFGAVARIHSWDTVDRAMTGVGWAVPGAVLSILDAAGRPVPDGETGELVVRTPWQMLGYVGAGGETVRADGGIRSGDLASRRPDGAIQLRGRLKELIITGGENVFPVEVERVLCGHPDVAEAAVIGLPDDHWGERVEAVVVLQPGAASSVETIAVHCRRQLAGYKVPKRISVRDVMPLTAAMKTDKRALKEWIRGR